MTARAAPVQWLLGPIGCRPSAMAMNEGQVSQSENDDRLKAWENKKLHSPFTKNLFIRLWYVFLRYMICLYHVILRYIDCSYNHNKHGCC